MHSIKRYLNIDLLRILACFMVVFLHTSSFDFYSYPVSSFNWQVCNVYDSLVRSSVALFLMISGALLLSNKQAFTFRSVWIKSRKLIIIYLLWSIIYALYYMFVQHKFSFTLSDLVKQVINGPVHFWYIPTIIIIYLLLPLLKPLVTKSNKKLSGYFCAAFFIGSALYTISACKFLPYYSYINLIFTKVNLSIVTQYLNYFLLGYYLYRFELLDKYHKYIYALGLLSFILCFVGTYLSFKSWKGLEFYDNFSIFTVIEACAIFLLFKKMKINSSTKGYNVITSVSGCTLGIYIIHMLVLNGLNDMNIVSINSFNPLLSIPVVSVLTFGISLIIVYGLRKIKVIAKYLL